MARKQTKNTTAAGTVTAIEPVRSDPTRRRILIGRTVAATLSDRDVEALGIDIGTRWTATLAGRVDRTIAMTKARTKALSMLGRSARTHGEIIAGLEKARFDGAIARAVAGELVEQGWVDDAQLATDAAEALSQRHVSHEMIAEKLRARHLPDDVAEEAASAALAEIDHVARATAFIKQKLAGKRGTPSPRDLRRMLGGLARKGFEEDDITAAFRSLGIDLERALTDSAE